MILWREIPMRFPAARLFVGATACIAIAAAAFFLFQSEKQIARERTAVRAFDLHAREAADALADLRAGQQAYVAAGQGVAFWMPKVAATSDTAATLITGLRRTATGAEAKSALDEAAATVAEFGTVDKRARDYIKSGQQLMAADVVFTEGGETAAAAARQVEAARLTEHQTLDASEAAAQKLEATAAGASAVLAVLAIALLVPVLRRRDGAAAGATEATLGLSAPPAAAEVAASASAASARAISPILKAAAQLCTDFGRVNNTQDLTVAVARAAHVMDASGMIIWLGSSTGADLRPVLAHGYSEQMLARMPNVPRSADNAAAAAYRTGTLQIVLARPGSSNGAIVAPLLSPDGCIGALSAEITGGGEASDSVQALAAIFAAQLAGVLQTTPTQAATGDTRAASS
jgi:CHASE3 domain sensor protein